MVNSQEQLHAVAAVVNDDLHCAREKSREGQNPHSIWLGFTSCHANHMMKPQIYNLSSKQTMLANEAQKVPN